MPVSYTYSATGTDTLNIPDLVYSIRLRIRGGSGGGEAIVQDLYLTATGGYAGGSSSAFGLVAGGGLGGGRYSNGASSKNVGGTGGVCTESYDWASLGATVITADGFKGALNQGGKGATIGTLGAPSGGVGTTGDFEYTSNIYHNYINPPGIHDFTNSGSTADVSVTFGGLELGGASCVNYPPDYYKNYTITYTVPFLDDTFILYDPYGVANFEADYAGSSFCKQAAGGSTTGPFYMPVGGTPNHENNKKTILRTAQTGSTEITQTWKASTNYGNGALVVHQGYAYRSLTGSNSGNEPHAYPDKWQELTVTSRQSRTRVWFCRAGGPTYIKCINFKTKGKKFGAVGRGGGGGAFIETTLTRQNLIDSVTYAPGTTQSIVVGGGGTRGGTNAGNGVNGSVEIYMLIIPTVNFVLTPEMDSENKVRIKTGESVNISWTVSGDADEIAWIAGEISNTNLTSNVNVSPIDTTVYSAYATGIAGDGPISSVTVIVYQIPFASLVCSSEVDYGEDIVLSYLTEYANISITITPIYTYIVGDSTGEVLGDPISITPVAKTAELTTVDSEKTVSNNNFIFSPIYTDFGPTQVRFLLEVEGDGGVANAEATTNIIIDRTPDNVVVPETDDKFKDEEPVYTPETDVLSELILVDGIDIPVEIKSNYPIQVDVNQEDNWRNIREL